MGIRKYDIVSPSSEETLGAELRVFALAKGALTLTVLEQLNELDARRKDTNKEEIEFVIQSIFLDKSSLPYLIGETKNNTTGVNGTARIQVEGERTMPENLRPLSLYVFEKEASDN